MTLWRKRIIQREGNQMSKQPEALRLADELQNTPFESTRYEAAAELRRLHEVNAELMQIFKRIRFEQCFVCECGIEDATWELIEANIAKATGEQR
jgi:hypothetical protein